MVGVGVGELLDDLQYVQHPALHQLYGLEQLALVVQVFVDVTNVWPDPQELGVPQLLEGALVGVGELLLGTLILFEQEVVGLPPLAVACNFTVRLPAPYVYPW